MPEPLTTWKDEIDNSAAFTLILSEGFYGSVGEEQLAYAISKGKPVLCIRLKGCSLPVPQSFQRYQGKHRLIIDVPDTPEGHRGVADEMRIMLEAGSAPIRVVGWDWETNVRDKNERNA